MRQRSISGKNTSKNVSNGFKTASVLTEDSALKARQILQKHCDHIRHCNEYLDMHEGSFPFDMDVVHATKNTETTMEQVLDAIQNSDKNDSKVRYLLAVLEKMAGEPLKTAASIALGDNVKERERVKDLKYWQIA